MKEMIIVLKDSIIEMFYLVGLIIITGLILGTFESISNKLMQKSFGRNGIFITASLGTPIHEIGHAVVNNKNCSIFCKGSDTTPFYLVGFLLKIMTKYAIFYYK